MLLKPHKPTKIASFPSATYEDQKPSSSPILGTSSDIENIHKQKGSEWKRAFAMTISDIVQFVIQIDLD